MGRFTLRYGRPGGLLHGMFPWPAFRIFTLGVLFGFATALAHADWTPPAKSGDAHKILDEAQADARAGRFEDALAKQVWFHQNALKLDQALRGVRLSFALGYWSKLGKAYPPAVEKLKMIRDEAGKDVREGREHRQAFIDFMAINDELKESDNTKALFLWLDANRSDLAKDVFDVAQKYLVRAGEYQLCGKYIDPDSSYERCLSLYRASIDSKGNNLLLRRYHRRYQNDQFSKDVAALVTLLVLNDRKADGDRIATKAAKEWKDSGFKKLLVKAKNGEFPPE